MILEQKWWGGSGQEDGAMICKLQFALQIAKARVDMKGGGESEN